MILLDDIKNSINIENLTELEVARLLYIELGKRVSFSTTFQNTSDLNMAKMMISQVDINTFKEKEVNCVMWAQLYSELLTKYGIRNEIIDKGHKYVEFYAENKKWVADATTGGYTDLSRIHNSDDTNNFGLSMFQNIDRSNNIPVFNEEITLRLKEIDKKIGYNDEKYKDLVELKEMIKKIKDGEFDIHAYVKGEGSDTLKKLQFLFAKVGVLDLGYYEAKDFLYELELMLLSPSELANVKGKELLRTNKDGSVDIIEIITVKEEDKYNYFVVCPNMKVKQVSMQDVIKFSLIGFGKDADKHIPGIDFPTNFVPGKRKSGVKLALERVSNYKIRKDPNLIEVERALR